jgi:hypothetical protein
MGIVEAGLTTELGSTFTSSNGEYGAMTKEQFDEICERHRVDAQYIARDPMGYGYGNSSEWIDELMLDREALLEKVDRLTQEFDEQVTAARNEITALNFLLNKRSVPLTRGTSYASN